MQTQIASNASLNGTSARSELSACRAYSPATDYGIIASWWQDHYGIDFLPPQCLPMSGLVIEDRHAPVACTFVFKADDCNVASIAFTAASPHVSNRVRIEAVKHVLAAAVGLARRLVGEPGFIWMTTDHPVVHEVAMRHVGMADGGSLFASFAIAGDEIDHRMLGDDHGSR